MEMIMCNVMQHIIWAPVLGVSDIARLEQTCSATETS